MSRTTTTRKAQQLDLMTIPAPALPPSQAAYEAAQRQIAQLTEQLRAAKVQHELLHSTNTALLRQLAEARQQQPNDAEALKRDLIKLAHPDRWSQGQLATELAHDITVRLTAGKKPRR